MSFDFHGIIESMDDLTFEYCKTHLWEIMNYNVLKIEDVRKIDLEERIIELERRFLGCLGEKTENDLVFYLKELKTYFTNFLSCKSGSRSSLYYTRGLEIISLLINEEYSADEEEEYWDSLLMIYVSLFRVYRDCDIHNTLVDNMRKYSICDSSFYLDADDYEMPYLILKDETVYPLEIAKYSIKEGKKVKTYLSSPDRINAEKNFVYMITILNLSTALQNAGIFYRGELHD